MKWVLFFLPCLFLSACASGGKRLDELEQALRTSAQDLESKCKAGQTGACALLGRYIEPSEPTGILQGPTSTNQSRLAVLVKRDSTIGYFVRSGSAIRRVKANRVERSGSEWAVDQIELFDLQSSDANELLVVNARGELLDQRVFRTLNPAKIGANVAILSCADDTQAMQALQHEMWGQMLKQKPDAILMIGDNVYADHLRSGKWQKPDALQLWNRYAESRDSLYLYKARELVPVVATWDDHDYGVNDGDRTNPIKAEAMRAFFAFFPQEKPATELERGPGVSSWWKVFGVQFALLDDRSFRTPNKLDSSDQTHFGPEQELYINSRLQAAREPVILISGDQFFGGYHRFESYEGSHPARFRAQLVEWKKAPVPLLFASGDRHLTEIMKIPRDVLGYPTYEITSSGIHTKVFADAFEREPNPRQLIGVAGVNNYSLMRIKKADDKQLRVTVRSYGPNRRVIYQNDLTVKRK